MLEIKYLRKNLSEVEEALAKRGARIDLSEFARRDEKKRKILQDLEELRHQRNKVSEEIARMKRSGENADEMVSQMREVSQQAKLLEKDLSENEEHLYNILVSLPNIPDTSVPVGKDETENVELRKVGEVPGFSFDPKAHWDIGDDLGILNFERAASMTGARFPLYLGAGAQLERALINFMLDLHTTRHGYKETLPPFMVNSKAMTNTGQLPKFEEDLFKVEGLNYYLIPTSEVPLTNIHQGEILREEDLPLYYTAYTPCFRSEAGSYGRDTRGLIRLHQFNKVELVKFSDPETSYDELEKLTANAEEVLKLLGLPYRVVTLCTGDMGFGAAKTYDIEVWMPSQNMYREISSCSNMTDFQARRANIRVKRKGSKKPELVHTLNGSGLAVGRTFAAILENFQQEDGSVIIPEVLRKYMGDMEKITR